MSQETFTLQELVKQHEAKKRCNCDFDSWEPEASTGHSWVCRIHEAATEEYKQQRPAPLREPERIKRPAVSDIADPTSKPPLLPCPFCGSEAKETPAFIECPSHTCPQGLWVKEGNIAAWNKRAPHPAVAALLAVEKLFADERYYIGTRDGADPLAIDATMLLIAQAVRAAKGEQ